MDFPRHAGFFIRTWAEAYARPRRGLPAGHPDAACSLRGQASARLRLAAGCDRQARCLRLAAGCDRQAAQFAAECVVSDHRLCHHRAGSCPSRCRLGCVAFVASQDKTFCKLTHDLDGAMGFVIAAEAATGKPTGPVTKVWEAQYGAWTTGSVGLMCASRYQNGGGPEYRELVVAAADAYLRTSPGEDVDSWPLTFGHAISLELAASRRISLAHEAYLRRSERRWVRWRLIGSLKATPCPRPA